MLKCFGSFLKTAKLPTTFMLKKSYLFVTTDRHIMSQVTIGNVARISFLILKFILSAG